MEKRVSSRGIIIENNKVIAMFRRKVKDDGSVKEYYVIPGGGLEEGETLEDSVKRELKEEFSVDIEILGYLGQDEAENSVAHFFNCKIIDGVPKLGGEELERGSKENYYEIRKIPLQELNKEEINILPVNIEYIEKAIKKDYKKF